jgi:hypothetical protein
MASTTKREIAGTRAKSDYDSNLLRLNLIGGYGWQVNPRLRVDPRLAARSRQRFSHHQKGRYLAIPAFLMSLTWPGR